MRERFMKIGGNGKFMVTRWEGICWQLYEIVYER